MHVNNNKYSRSIFGYNISNIGYLKIFLALVVAGSLVWFIPGPDQVDDIEKNDKLSGGKLETGAITRKINLFIPDNNQRGLIKLPVEIESEDSIDNRILMTLKTLLSEPVKGAVILSPGIVINDIFIHQDMAVISLEGSFRRKYQGGIWTELLTVYSIVNSVVENFTEINRVKIVIDDSETDFFVSHVNISRPLTPDVSVMIDENS